VLSLREERFEQLADFLPSGVDRLFGDFEEQGFKFGE
jgi:hypothetical protein